MTPLHSQPSGQLQLIRHLPARVHDPRPTALAIGNFDGLHRGHLALIQLAVAQQPELVPALMCFEPLPRTFFQPEQPVPRLMGLRDRIDVCRSQGIERVFQLTFDAEFSNLSPQAFVETIVLAGAKAKHVIVGNDFCFGQRALGNVDVLRQMGLEHHFKVSVIESVQTVDRQRVSSTQIRRALRSGQLALAAQLLGRPYRIAGRVLRGQQLGRTMGFPTVNLRVPEPPALSGIFAVWVERIGKSASTQRWPGVASLGTRPTVNGRSWLLEVHLLDYEGDLYGQHLSVHFVAKRRDEAHFSSVESMVLEMQSDTTWARTELNAATD